MSHDLRTKLIRLAHTQPEHRSDILDLLKRAKAISKQAYGHYDYDDYDDRPDPSDYMEMPSGECPEDEEEYSFKAFEKETRKNLKKIANEFKRQGWKVDRFDVDDRDKDDDRWIAMVSLEMSLKAGQTLQLGGKKITADRPLSPTLLMNFYGYEGESETGYEEEQVDVDDFITHAFEYTCPGEDLDEFALEDLDDVTGGRVRHVLEKRYGDRDVKKFCEEFTKDYMLNSTRSKLKKRATETTMTSNRTKLIHLAHENPELRSKILPHLKQAGGTKLVAYAGLETDSGHDVRSDPWGTNKTPRLFDWLLVGEEDAMKGSAEKLLETLRSKVRGGKMDSQIIQVADSLRPPKKVKNASAADLIKSLRGKSVGGVGGNLTGRRAATYAGEFTYMVVTQGNKPQRYTEKDFMRKYRSSITGWTPEGGRLREELWEQPKIRGLLGPMWNGLQKGKAEIRYEDQATYNQMSLASTKTAGRFSLGRLVQTRGVDHKTRTNDGFGDEIKAALSKYIRGDWGISKDKRMNDAAVKSGDDRIMGVYPTSEGDIWIITEWDRSVTTILFPSEY